MTQATIVSNVKSVFKNADINKLRPEAYHFITLHMGFIAHYDIHGFRAEYADLRDFAANLQSSEMSGSRDYNDNWAAELVRRGEHETAATIRAIVALARGEGQRIAPLFAQRQRDREVAVAEKIASKYGLTISSQQQPTPQDVGHPFQNQDFHLPRA